MGHEHDTPSKLEMTLHTVLPLLLMLFIEIALNHLASPAHSIFISPYLLAFFICCLINFIVLWKGQICPGQTQRLLAILPWLFIFAFGNMLYSVGFTPKHSPALIVGVSSLILPFIYWRLPKEENLRTTAIYCGLAIVFIGVLQYVLIYWVEIPSLFNWIRANNIAQLLLGVLLAGWYLMLAKSRLEGFLKLLVIISLGLLVINYLWVIFVLYQQFVIMPQLSIIPYMFFFVVQFGILAMLAWILLGKNIKNPIPWTLAMILAMLYPLTNVI